MVKSLLLVFGATLLMGCTTLNFYSSEVGSDWATEPVKFSLAGISAAGVKIQFAGEEYSPVTSVGTLFTPRYQGDRKQSWNVTGPSGLKATVEVIQTGLVFGGPVDRNILHPQSIEFEHAKQTIRVVTADSTFASTPDRVTRPPVFVVGSWGLAATHQATNGKEVVDYEKWGMSFGLRMTKDGALMGFLSSTGGFHLLTPPQGAVDPILVALALVSCQADFNSKTPALTLAPEVIDFFGLKLRSVTTSHG